MARKTFLSASVALILVGLVILPASATSVETPVITGGADQEGPAAATNTIAWTLYTKSGFWLYANTGAGDFVVNPAKTWGATGGIDGSELVYQRVNRAGSDIYLYDLAGSSQLGAVPHVNTRYWEYAPSNSGDWVLFNRNNINIGPKEWQRVVLVNTNTGEKRILAHASANAYLNAGQVNGNWATWEVFTSAGGFRAYRYDIAGDSKIKLPDVGNREPYAPAVASDGTAYYMVSGPACGKNASLVRRLPDGTTDVINDLPAGVDAWDLYEFTDATLEQDVYYTRINDCSQRVWKGDVYYVDAADSRPPLSPVISPEAPVAPGAPAAHRPVPAVPEALRAAPAR